MEQTLGPLICIKKIVHTAFGAQRDESFVKGEVTVTVTIPQSTHNQQLNYSTCKLVNNCPFHLIIVLQHVPSLHRFLLLSLLLPTVQFVVQFFHLGFGHCPQRSIRVGRGWAEQFSEKKKETGVSNGTTGRPNNVYNCPYLATVINVVIIPTTAVITI